jgi:hypothetical protein
MTAAFDTVPADSTNARVRISELRNFMIFLLFLQDSSERAFAALAGQRDRGKDNQQRVEPISYLRARYLVVPISDRVA